MGDVCIELWFFLVCIVVLFGDMNGCFGFSFNRIILLVLDEVSSIFCSLRFVRRFLFCAEFSKYNSVVSFYFDVFSIEYC